jgi:6-phosphofructokinase 1
MGTNGFLALASGLATGAEKVYIPEEDITLIGLQNDVDNFVQAFKAKKCVLVINSDCTK